jgi:hypothetical protein
MERIEQGCRADVQKERGSHRKQLRILDGSAPAYPVEVANLTTRTCSLEDSLHGVNRSKSLRARQSFVARHRTSEVRADMRVRLLEYDRSRHDR